MVRRFCTQADAVDSLQKSFLDFSNFGSPLYLFADGQPDVQGERRANRTHPGATDQNQEPVGGTEGIAALGSRVAAE